MKTIFIALSVFMAANTVSFAQNNNAPSKNREAKNNITYKCPMHPEEMSVKEDECSKCGMKMKEVQITTYTCPMHPEEMSMKKGKCGKCGMELVNITKSKHNPAVKGSQVSTVAEAKYVCTMGCATSDKAGKCPKCGMEMTKETQKATYTCPMHPKEMSMKEGECGKCGMKLVKTAKLIHNTAIKDSQSSSQVTTKYVCTMDGATSEKAGKCPKCGMDMTPIEGVKKAVKHQH